MVDLHIHTINSSGTDSLEEILKKAEESNVKVISLTDNENIEVYNELKNEEIRKLYAQGASLKELQQQFNKVSKSTIYRVCKNLGWNNI